MYKNLTTICAAAALALGLAACGGGGGGGPTGTGGTGSGGGGGDTTMSAACDTASQACVDEKSASLTAAEESLAALRADDSATLGQIAAAEQAVADARTALETAQADLTAYNEMQPPMYGLKAMAAAVAPDTPTTLGGEIVAADDNTSTVDGGKVTVNNTETPPANTYSKATWPVPTITGWMGSVWERSDDAAETKDSVVVYTNIQDPKGAKWSVFYAATAPTGVVDGFTWAARDAVVSAVDSDGVITFLNSEVDADGDKLFSSSGFGISHPDGDDETADVQVEFAGMFHGVSGTFKCSAASCVSTVDSKGNLVALIGTWTFAPTSTSSMVADVRTDADYLDFGYWVQTDVSGETDSYKVDAFFRGSAAARTTLPTGTTSTDTALGTAIYTGSAVGLYAKRDYASGGDGAVLAAGRFTADASLTAVFGELVTVPSADHNSIEGTIRNFRDGGQPIDASWVLELNKIGGTDGTGTWGGTLTGGTTTGSGAWNGNFYGGADAERPTGIAGKFTGSFDNGDVIGSFGATKN